MRTADAARWRAASSSALEAGIAQVVGVLRDPVALDAGVARVERLGHQRDAQLPQRLLVALERPPEGAVVLGVAREPEAQLVDGERALGLQQGGDQVDEPLEPVHGPPMRTGVRRASTAAVRRRP